MHRAIRFVWLCVFYAASACAQVSPGPVLTGPPNVQYPPIARAARVTGKVVVDFSIDSNGSTVSVQTVSGPEMLRGAVENQIRQWRFKTPLPVSAQVDFEATYTFGPNSEAESLEDDLDGPPYVPCCGDVIALSPQATQVKGEVRSVTGSQSIDVSPAATPVRDRCPDDKQKHPLTSTAADDFVELYRTTCGSECLHYRVLVYRDGHVEWHGEGHVAAGGERSARIKTETSANLLAKFGGETYWSACPVSLPSREEYDDPAEDTARGDYLNVRIGGLTKPVEVGSFEPDSTGVNLAWAVDKAANTHLWRHGDAASEFYTNMVEDLQMPKVGITALMRATYRFSTRDVAQTWEPLKSLVAKGADLDAADESGWTALMYAAELGSEDGKAVHILVEAHAGVNRVSLHGDTALMMAAYNGVLSEELLSKGANINAHNTDGVTALMLLAQRVDPDRLKEAIAAGADAKAQDNAGRTALDYLRAASCQRPLIALPRPWIEIVPKESPRCPSTTEEFLESEAVLENAMKKISRHL
jgi:TonB family protein